MNNYEETASEMKRQSEGPKRLSKNAIGIGSAAAGAAGAAAFAPILARAAPFLSQYIPENLAIKGLSKIHPKLGKFVNDALKSGNDFEEVKDFLGEQIKESQPAKEDRNIIEQYSPELHMFIMDHIKKGRSPIEAAALASLKGSNFSKVIKKLQDEHKVGWGKIVENIYGAGEKSLPKQNIQPQSQGQNSQGQQQQSTQGQEYFDYKQPNQGGQEGQGQQLDAQVAQIMQQGAEILKRFRGKS